MSEIKHEKHGFKDFEKLLSDVQLYEKFKLQAEKDRAAELFLFWEHYKETKENTSAALSPSALYEKFCRANAESELNLSGQLRIELSKKVKQGPLKLEDFDPVVNEVKTMMYNNIYHRFLTSLN